jgi:hypothetical protein
MSSSFTNHIPSCASRITGVSHQSFFGGQKLCQLIKKILQSGKKLVFYEVFWPILFKSISFLKISKFYPKFQQVAKNIEGC